MHRVAANVQNHGAWLGTGRIKAQEAERYLVETEFGVMPAERTADCLLVPETGDRVLLVWDGPDEVFIMSVLKRGAPDSPAMLDVRGDATLQSSGHLNLAAEDVNIGGVEGVSVMTKRFDLSSLEAEARFDRFLFQGDLVSGRVRTLKTMAVRLETTAERIMERCRRYYRRVDDFEDVRAGRIRLWVRDLFAVKSKSTAIKSEDRIKLDADKILLG